jgi:hypothetical protein
MSLTPDESYFELGRLLAEVPDLAAGEITPAIKAWLKRADELVQDAGGLADLIQLRVATQNIDGPLRVRHARSIATIVQRALERAEQEVSDEARGAFISATNAFDVFAAVRRVLASAQAEVLLVDAHADATVLTDYAALAPDGIAVHLLTGETDHRETLVAAADNWLQRFGDHRPLDIRVAAAEALTDSLILVDSVTVWIVGASFSELARGELQRNKRTTLMRLPPDAAEGKAAVYGALWESAEPL